MIAEYRTALHSYSRDIRLILIVSAIVSFTVDGVFPVIFNLYILRMGYGPEFVGQVNSVALVVFAVASLPAGTLGTRFGARPLMIWGVVISFFSTFALAATDLVPPAAQPLWLIGMFSLLYLGVALYFVNASPALVNSTRGVERSRVISIQSAASNLFAFVGGPVAGFVPVLLAAALGWSILEPAAYSAPLYISAFLFLVAIVLIVRVHVHPAETEETVSGSPGAPSAAVGFIGVLMVLSLVRLLTATGLGAGLTFFNVYMDDALGVSTATIGMIVAASHLVSVFTVLTVPMFVRRWGSANSSIGATIGSGLSLLPLAMIPLWPVAGASFITMGAFGAVRYSSFFVYMMEVTPPRFRTTMAGAGEFAGGMGFALASLVGGYMIVTIGYTALFVVAGLVTISGAIVLWVYVAWRGARHQRPIPLQPSLALSPSRSHDGQSVINPQDAAE